MVRVQGLGLGGLGIRVWGCLGVRGFLNNKGVLGFVQ